MIGNAKWIEAPLMAPPIYALALCPEFKREFDLAAAPAQATLQISGVGFYTAKINGQPVTTHLLTPAYTAYDKRVYFDEYDVAALLKAGKNEITVELGNGWYAEKSANAWEFEHASWHACPKMIAALSVDGECALVSDPSWSARASRTTFSQLREGETYDASIVETPWGKAHISRGPGGLLQKYDGPAVEVEEVLDPVKVTSVDGGTLYDFGVNLAGNCEVTATGSRGSSVKMVYAERITSDNQLDRENIAMFVQSDRFQTDEYILAGEGEETWHSLYTYHGFRYVMVSGDAKVVKLQARGYHTSLPAAGGFECDNELLNAIQRAVVRSTKTNFHHMPTDCPHREKNGWTGDAHLSCEQALLNLDIAPAYKKWLRDFGDAQRPNGALPGILPTATWGYSWGNGVSWDCASIVIPWQTYMATGDDAILRDNFAMMEKYIDYMTTLTENHISTIGLGDWCPPKEAKQMNTPALLTAISIRLYQLMEKICKVTGLGDPAKYADLAAVTTKVFKDTFVGEVTEAQKQRMAEMTREILSTLPTDAPEFVVERAEKSVVDTYFGPVEDSQTFLSMLLWFGLADDRADVTARLVKQVNEAGNHILTGIFGAKFLLDALTDNGQFDLAYEIATQRDYPGWGHMLSNGSGTLWEDWAGENSLNHHMFSPIGAWFYKGIAGIRIEEAGYKKVRVAPHVPKDMHSFKAWHNTPLGRLEVLWKDGKLTVTAPAAMDVVLDTDLNAELVRA